jgi:type I restriction enzyme S subunit
VEADEENLVPYIGMENIESWTGRLLPIDADVVPTGTANEFKANHTLFGKLRPYLAKACNPGFDGLCSTELLVLDGVELRRDALLYSLLSDGFINLVDASTYGSKMPRASWDFIGNCALAIAPLDEQRAIAGFLYRETAKIDTLVTENRTLIERLKEKRTALISRTVTRGLPADTAGAAGLDPHPKLKPSGIAWLGEIPEHWKVCPIKEFARSGRRTFTDGDWIELPFITDEGIRLIQTGNIGIGEYREQGFRYISEDSFRDLDCTEVQPNDILICRLDGPVGRACLAPDLGVRMVTSVDNTIVKVRDDISPKFVVYLLSSAPWLNWVDALCRVGGGFRLRISRTMLGNNRAPSPPFDEQSVIVDFLDRETKRIDAMVAKVETAIERLQEYRIALITAATTGKIDVRRVTA